MSTFPDSLRQGDAVSQKRSQECIALSLVVRNFGNTVNYNVDKCECQRVWRAEALGPLSRHGIILWSF